MKVILGARARRDLADLSDWIAQNNPDAASDFVDQIVITANEIGDMPLAFPVYVRSGQREVRKRVYRRRYLIFYAVSGQIVRVLRIVHGSRDLTKLFRS